MCFNINMSSPPSSIHINGSFYSFPDERINTSACIEIRFLISDKDRSRGQLLALVPCAVDNTFEGSNSYSCKYP